MVATRLMQHDPDCRSPHFEQAAVAQSADIDGANTKPIVLAASGVLGLGLITAAAADNHGAVVSAVAKASRSLTGPARGEAVSTVARTNGKADAATRAAHGVAVSAIAKSELTLPHATGAKRKQPRRGRQRDGSKAVARPRRNGGLPQPPFD